MNVIIISLKTTLEAVCTGCGTDVFMNSIPDLGSCDENILSAKLVLILTRTL